MKHAPPPSSRAFLSLLPDLRRSALRLSGSVEDADDLVQETLLKVWARVTITHLGNSDAAPVDDLRAYAFATLRNCARRAAAPVVSTPEDVALLPAPPDEAPARLAYTDAIRALDNLPPDQARLLRMRALEGLTYDDIARQTGLPLGTVTSRLSRGRAALRAALGLPRDAPVSDLFRGD
ncbi:MAG: RNA polymerase sigma factor [Pseudomonadota bacterium]